MLIFPHIPTVEVIEDNGKREEDEALDFYGDDYETDDEDESIEGGQDWFKS